jgi:hypothetical protein
LRHIRVGGATLTLDLKRGADEIALLVKNDGAPVKMSFEPELPLGAKVDTARIGNRDITARLLRQQQDAHARVDFDVPQGDTVLRIRYTGGVAIIPTAPRPIIGEASRAMKIVGLNMKDRVYAIEIDHMSAEASHFELRTPWKIENVQGARFEALAPASYRLTIEATSGNAKGTYKRSKVLVTFGDAD